MSRKTVIFRRKIRQMNANRDNVHMLIPSERIKGVGIKSKYVITDGVDDDGNPTRTIKRVPGENTGLVCTEPMGDIKRQKYINLVPKGK